MKKVFSDGGGSGVSDGEEVDGGGGGAIAQFAQFPITSFDKKNKGLTSIIENLNLKVMQHQKGK